MINRSQLLKELQGLLGRIEADLLERSNLDILPEVRQSLRSEYEQAKDSVRTAQSYEEWRSDYAMHIGAAWVLSCVFVRFLEDNGLIDPPMISGVADRLQRSRDEHEQYFRSHPTETDREYLLAGFGKLAKLSGGAEIFGQHNPVYEVPTWLSGDAAGELLRFFRQINPGTGTLVHDFTDANWDTRFLGDLYQDLSERARKKYALLQTPNFVEQFILERTLEPAIEEFGLQGFRMIDPACGSGHFLLGAFQRLIDRWYRQDPNEKYAVLVQRALDSVHGVDINPFAIAIARFRLLLAAMKEAGIAGLRNAPDFKIHLACGDSLLHGEGTQLPLAGVEPLKKHHYRSEDVKPLNQILIRGHYHAVVANPPYIVPKDAAANGDYRKRYKTCHRQYSLAVPFMERIFQLAIDKGFTGQITANSFMKREFGKKLIEEFFPTVDLTYVIDTSGAYIPGHGTPTVIVLGRNRKFIGNTIRTVMGIKGEPSTPDDPAQGKVWSAILNQVDQPRSQSEFVSVADSVRDAFHQHPWSIGGGGAADLKQLLDEGSTQFLADVVTEIGFSVVTREDEVYLIGEPVALRQEIAPKFTHPLVAGENVRDWSIQEPVGALFPYDESSLLAQASQPVIKFLWLWKQQLSGRVAYGYSQIERGLQWFEYSMFFTNRFRIPLSIAFASVATHNHFVLDRGGKVFKQSSPVIKLPANSTEEDHIALLSLLNSSTGCFWMKQVFYPKGGDYVGNEGARVRKTLWDERYDFAGTGLQSFPLSKERPTSPAQIIDQLATQWSVYAPDALLKEITPHLKERLTAGQKQWAEILALMISLQEELDWQCYQLYKLIDEDLTYEPEKPQIQLGQRAFEIIMARKMAAGELETTWFERHNSTPITELPDHWSDDYKRLVDRRIEIIETNKNISLIEQPEYKRRWNTEPWDSQLERALQNWLLDRLETYFDFDGRMNDNGTARLSAHGEAPTAQVPIALLSTAKLADLAQQDPDFMQVGALYRHSDTFHLQTLIDELIEAESVPLLPILRYKPSGLRKRAEWEHTWTLQRQEDAIDARTQLPADHPDHLTLLQAKDLKTREIGTIPVPPKYTSADFLKSHYWRLRGKLDVPKERWLSFPYCEGNDGKMAIAWAGYDHLQLTQALSNYYIDIKENLGGSEDPRLIPILACLLELLPWLKQWHGAIDPTYGYAMSDYFEDFIQEEARYLNQTLDQIRAWEPPKRTNRRR